MNAVHTKAAAAKAKATTKNNRKCYTFCTSPKATTTATTQTSPNNNGNKP